MKTFPSRITTDFDMADGRIRKILFVLIITILALCLLEAIARVLQGTRPGMFVIKRVPSLNMIGTEMIEDRQLLWRVPPGSFTIDNIPYRINSRGMRGDEPASEKPAGGLRIMFLGDSTIFGHGVFEAQAFPYLAGKMLEQRLGRPVEVINMAIPGYSSTQCRIAFEDNVDTLKPDIVVLAAMWSDNIPTTWTDADLLRRFSGTGYRFTGATRRAFRQSALFTLLEARIESLKPIPDDRILFWKKVLDGQMDGGRPRVSIKHLPFLPAGTEGNGARK